MAPKGAKAACSASTDGGAAPSHTTLTDLALNDLIVASRELIVPSALPSAWGQSAHWSWLGDDYASTLLYRKYNYNDYTTVGSLYIAYTCREFTLGYFRNGLPRGWAAEAWAARRWRAPFRSTSLRAEEPAANDAAGPKNGQAGKVAWRGIGPLRARRFPRPTPARARRGGWEGPCQISRPTARFLPETASRRETRTTHRPTSYEPLLPNSSQIVVGHVVNDVRRCGGPIGSKRRQKRRS